MSSLQKSQTWKVKNLMTNEVQQASSDSSDHHVLIEE